MIVDWFVLVLFIYDCDCCVYCWFGLVGVVAGMLGVELFVFV